MRYQTAPCPVPSARMLPHLRRHVVAPSGASSRTTPACFKELIANAISLLEIQRLRAAMRALRSNSSQCWHPTRDRLSLAPNVRSGTGFFSHSSGSTCRRPKHCSKRAQLRCEHVGLFATSARVREVQRARVRLFSSAIACGVLKSSSIASPERSACARSRSASVAPASL